MSTQQIQRAMLKQVAVHWVLICVPGWRLSVAARRLYITNRSVRRLSVPPRTRQLLGRRARSHSVWCSCIGCICVSSLYQRLSLFSASL